MSDQEDIGGIIERARRATHQRDWLEALRCWEAVRAISPGHVSAYLGAGNALREAGRYDDAELALGAGAERFPDNEQIAISRASLANARRDWPTALRRWEAVRARFPENPWCYLGNVNALRGAGRSDQVETLLATAETKGLGLDAAASLRVEFEIARARFDWPAVRRSAEKIIASEAAPSAKIFLARAQACWHLGEQEEADGAALQALSADPTLTEALLVRVQVATSRGDGETALSCYRALVELNPGVVRWWLKLVQLLNWLGRVSEALSVLETTGNRWPNDPMVRVFIRNYGTDSEPLPDPAISASRLAKGDPDYAKEEELEVISGKAPDPAERVRPLLVADPQRDVLVAEVAGAESAVLVFTGTNDEASMPLLLFDRYLATLNLTTVYLKDFKRLRFLQGIQSLSDDYQGTLRALRDTLSGLRVKRVCTLGNCVGGFAAIRYGVELNADRILAFSPPTHSPRDSPTRLEEGRNFMKHRLEANVPRDMMDLRPLLENRQYTGQIELFYEEEDPRDRMNALRLSGLPGVMLHPRPELSYRLLRRLASSSEDFRGMLAKLLSSGPAQSG